METVHHEAVRVGAPESDTERASRAARSVVEHAQGEIGAALARIDRAVGALLDVQRSGHALAALIEAGALVMIAEGETRRLIERAPRLHEDGRGA